MLEIKTQDSATQIETSFLTSEINLKYYKLKFVSVARIRSPAPSGHPLPPSCTGLSTLLLLTVGENGEGKRAYQIDKRRQQEHSPPRSSLIRYGEDHAGK